MFLGLPQASSQSAEGYELLIERGKVQSTIAVHCPNVYIGSWPIIIIQT